MFLKNPNPVFVVFGLLWCFGSLWAERDSFREGIKTHADWYERFDQTHDYRIFYLLANRAGKLCDVAKAKETSSYLKDHPDQREEVFKRWGIDIDVEEFNAKALEEWQNQFGEESIDIPYRNYHVFATRKDEKIAKVLAMYMDLIFKFYQKKFKMDEEVHGRFMVHLYPDKATFKEKSNISFAFAYFSASERSLVGYTEAFNSPSEEKDYAIRLIHTFFHEGFHQFLSYYVPNPPTWLNEGMAEIFEAVVFRGKRLYENKNISNYNLSWLKEYLRDNKTTPLKKLIYMTQSEMYQPDLQNMHYAQSWGLIHFLAFGSSKNKKFYQDLIQELKDGADREEAIDRVFSSVDWELFEEQYQRYILRLKPTTGESKF